MELVLNINNKNVTVNFSIDEDQKKWYGVEYHISF